MKTLEIIHLRLTGNSHQDLMNIIEGVLNFKGEEMDIRIYRQTKLANDLAVHIHRETKGKDKGYSNTGLRLATLLKEYGMVAHSVWTAYRVEQEDR